MRFIDDEIAHITRAMAPSLYAGTTPAVFSFDYWYTRLCALLDLAQITPSQFRSVDALMVELESRKAASGAAVREALAA
ncbi:MAG TPA: hypothetical protein VJU59_23080 [Paraburkholderia sp.]|uniref:hypothetical protein n=1 Tax=Paraburkholderia sp. TaxID=1926495 RepID=UPI002B499983|nr:hypothetical protein [Paraburkholderia sp.]HKR42517.1 hypothetical protein [Paraburkholderia sp.]